MITLVTAAAARTMRCCGPEGCGSRSMDGVRYCIESHCMAWRISDRQYWERPDGKLVKTDREPADGRGHWSYVGYCGLGGQP